MLPGGSPKCSRKTFGVPQKGKPRYTIVYVTEFHPFRRQFRTPVTHRRRTPNPTSPNATAIRHKNQQYVLPNARRNPFPNPLTYSKIKTIQREKTTQPPPHQTPPPKFSHSHPERGTRPAVRSNSFHRSSSTSLRRHPVSTKSRIAAAACRDTFPLASSTSSARPSRQYSASVRYRSRGRVRYLRTARHGFGPASRRPHSTARDGC